MGRFDLKNDFLQSEEMYFCGPCGPCLDKRGWICEKASALMSIVDYTFYCLFQNLKTRKPYFAARGEISLVSQGKESITHGCYQAWSRAQLNQLPCQMAPCSEDSICICHFHRAILRWTLGTLENTSIFQGPGEIFPVEPVPRRGALLRPVISSVSLVTSRCPFRNIWLG